MEISLNNRSFVLADVTSDWYRTACRVRIRETLSRVDGRIAFPALDVGEANSLSHDLRITRNTYWDLNSEWPEQQERYRTVTCFEVIEHVQNPLLLLESIREAMEPGGRLFLTTPVAWWMGRGEHHFHEFTQDDLVCLLQMAGFVIDRLERMPAYTWDWRYFGVRPVVRLLRDRLRGQCFYVEAVNDAAWNNPALMKPVAQRA